MRINPMEYEYYRREVSEKSAQSGGGGDVCV